MLLGTRRWALITALLTRGRREPCSSRRALESVEPYGFRLRQARRWTPDIYSAAGSGVVTSGMSHGGYAFSAYPRLPLLKLKGHSPRFRGTTLDHAPTLVSDLEYSRNQSPSRVGMTDRARHSRVAHLIRRARSSVRLPPSGWCALGNSSATFAG